MAPHAEMLANNHILERVWEPIKNSEHKPNDTSSYGWKLTHACIRNNPRLYREVADELGPRCNNKSSQSQKEQVAHGNAFHAELFL